MMQILRHFERHAEILSNRTPKNAQSRKPKPTHRVENTRARPQRSLNPLPSATSFSSSADGLERVAHLRLEALHRGQNLVEADRVGPEHRAAAYRPASHSR